MAGQKRIQEIEIELLQPNPLQPRGMITPESLVELVDSIREHGILEPLVVAETPAGFQIIAGERRWRAAKIAGLKTVPAIVKKATPSKMLEMALVENVQREDLNPLERAKAFQRLMSEFGLSNKNICQRISKSSSYVSNTLRLLRLPDILKDGLLSGQISEGHARALAALEESKLIVEAYKKVLKENLSVRGAEEIVRRMRVREGTLGKKKGTPVPTKKKIRRPSRRLDEMEADLKGRFEEFAVKPRVKISQSQVQARMTLVFNGDMETTDQALQFIHRQITGKSPEG